MNYNEALRNFLLLTVHHSALGKSRWGHLVGVDKGARQSRSTV